MAQKLGRKPTVNSQPVSDKPVGDPLAAALIEQFGLDAVFDAIGEDKILEWLNKLSSAKKRASKRRLERRG
jgi:hypothetical protein